MGLWGSYLIYFQTMRFGGDTCQKLQVGGFEYTSRIYIYIYILTHIFICKAQWCLEWWSPVTHVFSVCIYIYVYIYIYSNYIAYVLGVYAETSKQVVTCALPRSRDFNSSVHPRVHLCLCIIHLFQKKAICASVYACVFCCLCF